MTVYSANTESLSVNEQYALITDIQNVPTAAEVLEDGSEYVTYGVTPASEAAGARLTAAFMPAIERAARRSKLKGREDESLAVAMEAFVRAVREYDLTSDTPFHHTLPGRLRHAVLASDRLENPAGLSIPEVQVARYHRALHANGLDPVAAHRACDADAARWDISGEAFLAVHHALNGGVSLQAGGAFASSSSGHQFDLSDSVGTADVMATPSPEDEILTRDYARWLLAQTTDRQEQICRLAYGFTDLDTERLRLIAGYRVDEDVLTDLQVADCLGMARSTVARERGKALDTMRAAAESAIAQEEA